MATSSLSISIIFAGGAKLGSDKIALLEAIDAQGSITAAAQSLGITYRTAWVRLESVNCILRNPAVATKSGGHKRGGATLTATGVRLVALYRGIESRVQSAAPDDIRELCTLAADAGLI